MEAETVPDFFQNEDEESLRSRAQWLDKELGLDTVFLSKVMEMREAKIREWRNKAVHLTLNDQERFSALWYVILHLLSHFNYEPSRVRKLFEEEVSPNVAKMPRHPLSPPWIRYSSLKDYMKSCGVEAVNDVNRWITSLRFGNHYSTSS